MNRAQFVGQCTFGMPQVVILLHTQPKRRPPVPGGIRFDDALALLRELGAVIETSREGSRIGIVLFGEARVFHKPHPAPEMDKGAVAALRDWLEIHGVTP